jgi:hypothetical protein
MRKFNQATDSNAVARGGKRAKLIALGVLLLLGLFLIAFAYYGVRQFFTNYRVQSPVVFRPVVVKREIKKVSKTKKERTKIHRPLVKQVEASQNEASEATDVLSGTLESFPKYLTDYGAEAREWTLDYVSRYYSGDELIAFDNLLKKEAGYRYDAVNEIGACGIAQAYPCEKMNCPLTRDGLECQVQWVVGYLNGRYHGSPLEAWNFHSQNNWY